MIAHIALAILAQPDLLRLKTRRLALDAARKFGVSYYIARQAVYAARANKGE